MKNRLLVSVLILVFAGCSSRQVTVQPQKSPAGSPSASVTAAPDSAIAPGPRKKVAVADFRMESAYGQRRLGNAASDILVTELQQTGRFILVERARLATVMDEQKLSLAGLAESSTAANFGQLLGADAIVTGSVTKFGVNITSSDMLIGDSKTQTATADVNVRLIDVATGRILLSEAGSGKAVKNTSSLLGIGSSGGYDEALEGDALRAAIADVVGRLVLSMDRVRWSCRVAQKTDPAEVIIDAGEESRLTVGTVLTVIRLGKPVKSPSTGEILGYSEKTVGTIQVTGYFGSNGAVCKILKDGGISGGDLCRIVE